MSYNILKMVSASGWGAAHGYSHEGSYGVHLLLQVAVQGDNAVATC